VTFSSDDIFNYEQWAAESHNLAPSAYIGAVLNQKLPDDYLDDNLAKLEI
jgi:hypothetical protein